MFICPVPSDGPDPVMSSEMEGHGKVNVGAWVGNGMTAGAAFGVAIENIALGVGVGAAIGLAMGYLLRRWKSGL